MIEVGFVYYFILARFYDIDPLMQEKEGICKFNWNYHPIIISVHKCIYIFVLSLADLAISFEQEKAFRHYRKKLNVC